MPASATLEDPSPFGPGNPARPSLVYLFLRFLRHGLLAWGGPVAQVGVMHRELVERDGWVGEEKFARVLGVYQALPGPEATELAVYFGMTKRGRLGGLMAGMGFILPGVVFVTALAALYSLIDVTAGVAGALAYGLKPAVIALTLVAAWRLSRMSARTVPLALLTLTTFLVALFVPGASLAVVLLAAGALATGLALARRPPHALGGGRAGAIALPIGLLAFGALSVSGLGALFWVSLKAGLLSFGGAYTAIPFIQDGAVRDHAWITNGEFLDAFALAGVVPGPLIAVGTFVGYLAGGVAGAGVATLGLFLPAFAFTLLGHRFLEGLVEDARLGAFLQGVGAGAVGLIAAAAVPLARAALVDAWTVLFAALALLLLVRWRVPIPLVVLGSAALGLLARLPALLHP